MKKTMSIKINIEEQPMKQLMSVCSEIFNIHVGWAFDCGIYNKSKAHKALYETIREEYPQIPSGLIQTTRDVALEAVKSRKFKNRPVKKNTSAVRYDLRTMTLRGNQLSFSCIGKRQKVILNIPDYYKPLLKWKFKGGNICYVNNEFWAKLWFETKTPDLILQDQILGIDRGLYNICTLSTGENIKANKVREQQRKYLYKRKQIQAKGTPSAKRKLKQLSGKEKRFSKDFNHCITKYIASLPYGVFAIEDLKGIRNSRKSKKVNKWISSWPFYQFEQFLVYKAEAQGKKVAKVDARYTSQRCSCCKNISKKSRVKSKYNCVSCGFTEHADVNAAINIKQNFLSSLKRADGQADCQPANCRSLGNKESLINCVTV